MSSSSFCRRLGCSWRLQRTARRISTQVTAEHPPLHNIDDWTQLQLEREAQKSLIDHLTPFGSTQTRSSAWQPHHSLHRPASPHTLTLSNLVAAGAHLGHSTSLLNPNFTPYAYGSRAGITIIDLDSTVPLLRRATNLIRAIASRGGTALFVGTRPYLRAAVGKAAGRMGSQGFHIGERWLPGILTNRVQFFGREVVKGTKINPDVVIFLNPMQNCAAIRECAIEHIPTVGIVDSNVDPRIVMYPIPANDESQRTAELVAGVLSIAGREGIEIRNRQLEEQAAREQKMRERLERAREKGLSNRTYGPGS